MKWEEMEKALKRKYETVSVKEGGSTVERIIVHAGCTTEVDLKYLEIAFAANGLNGVIDFINNAVNISKAAAEAMDEMYMPSRVKGVVMNKDVNKEYLPFLPHRDVEGTDFIVAYHYEKQSGFMLIDNEFASKNNLTEQELYDLAIKHSPTVLKRLDGLVKIPGMDMLKQVYVLTNHQFEYGSFGIMNEKAREKLHELYGDKLIILPESVHSLLCIPYDEGDVPYYKEMAEHPSCSDAELLSNKLYLLEKGRLIAA